MENEKLLIYFNQNLIDPSVDDGLFDGDFFFNFIHATNVLLSIKASVKVKRNYNSQSASSAFIHIEE